VNRKAIWSVESQGELRTAAKRIATNCLDGNGMEIANRDVSVPQRHQNTIVNVAVSVASVL